MRYFKSTIYIFIFLLALTITNQAYAANNVFYSVSPYGTSTMETGAGNISIASGVATLTFEFMLC